MSLSKRLTAICRMVPAGCVPADIGTDHAAVPIELLRSGKCTRALACDVLEGPLSAARENIVRAGLSDRIGVWLSDGFQALPEGTYDAAVICGMGGQTIRRILEGRPADRRLLKTLVLSPQSEQEELRAYLRAEGFRIEAEDLILEEGKFYPVIRAVPAEDPPEPADAAPDPLTQRALDRFGPCLIRGAHPLLPEYLDRRERVLNGIAEGLEKAASGEGAGPRAAARRAEIGAELELIALSRKLWKEHEAWKT
ncbi:MAG: class I SAM-dependent methyltransferase [Lachnospiraceae bacterium]|nr:class I SAM-dependent methyltransferase [Lachnospiraceae bacterium]